MPPVVCIIAFCALLSPERPACDLAIPSWGYQTRTETRAACSIEFAARERDAPHGQRPTMWAARRAIWDAAP